MSYEVLLPASVQKQIKKLPADISKRIENALAQLEKNPRPTGSKKLKGRDGWRVRVGDYRILYDIIDQKLCVMIIYVGHRRDVYRDS